MQTSGEQTAMQQYLVLIDERDEGRCLRKRSSGSVYPPVMASESGDRLQVTHFATETAAARGDESPISVLL